MNRSVKSMYRHICNRWISRYSWTMKAKPGRDQELKPTYNKGDWNGNEKLSH